MRVLVICLTTAKPVMITLHYRLNTHLVIVNGLRVGHDVGSRVGCKRERKRKIENLMVIYDQYPLRNVLTLGVIGCAVIKFVGTGVG